MAHKLLLFFLLVMGVLGRQMSRPLLVGEQENKTYWLQQVERITPWWPLTRVPSNRTDIIFIKTHKTASSTMSSIFHRYCAEYSSTVKCYVPSGQGGAVVSPNLSAANLHRFSVEPVQVFAQHTQYWPNFLYTLVSEPAPIVTVIRNPVSRFLSTWDYRKFHWRGEHNIVKIVKGLSDDIHKLPPDFLPFLIHDSASVELCPQKPEWALSNASEPTCLQTLRDMMRGSLQLVLLTERLDEGLVLLARSMGWPLQVVVYSSMKVSGQHWLHSKPPPAVTQRIEGWLAEDKLLYEVAGALLDRRIESQDASFWTELREFQKLKERAHTDCIIGRHTLFSESSCKHLHQDNLQWVAEEHRRITRFLEQKRSL